MLGARAGWEYISHPKRPSAPVFRYWRYQAAAERAASAGSGGGSGGDTAAVACKEAEGALVLAQLPGDGAAAAAAWLRSLRCDAAAEAVDECGPARRWRDRGALRRDGAPPPRASDRARPAGVQRGASANRSHCRRVRR